MTPTYGCITCTCGPSCGDRKSPPPDYYPAFFPLPGNHLIPNLHWPIVEELNAKSDDKTLMVTNITHELNNKDTDFLNLFKPFGEVCSATLAPATRDLRIRGGYGFVTFVNKEDAQKAMDTLNGSAELGGDKGTLAVNWASAIKKPAYI
ncbi:hypothetical protein TSUD_331830 [Trifolium subterraneum]|uniref:RRM domain-containing protein n=1 Tax=Trifolium subterraneum TaxID=3900 RepID=A0A2Z6NKB6_TRISU|nr:hypothetical protein TSUD_331830 [Trifolium subterraneum]